MTDTAYVMPGGFIAVVGQFETGVGLTWWRGELRSTGDRVVTELDATSSVRRHRFIRTNPDKAQLLAALRSHAEQLAIHPTYWDGGPA